MPSASYSDTVPSGLGGGPGSVYISDTVAGYKVLIVPNNNGQKRVCYSLVDDDALDFLLINELHLNDSARIRLLDSHPVKNRKLRLQINEMIGDKSGIAALLYMAFLSKVFGTRHGLVAPCGTEQTTIETGCDPALPRNCVDHPADCNLFKTITSTNLQ